MAAIPDVCVRVRMSGCGCVCDSLSLADCGSLVKGQIDQTTATLVIQRESGNRNKKYEAVSHLANQLAHVDRMLLSDLPKSMY